MPTMDGKLKWFALLASMQLVLLGTAEGQRTFNRCTLALELDRLNVPRQEIPRWVYIAQEVSSYRANVVSPIDINGFQHYGIFQIGEQDWCKSAKGTKNICKVECSELIKDDIQPSLDCARIILREHGWSAWVEGEVDVNDCFETSAQDRNAAAPAPARTDGGGPREGTKAETGNETKCNKRIRDYR
ncbi:lysozyme P-like [Drosophila mojavensis]|uniref:lysozyme P-like n=1 Tax=Drosophila mojavensis TaxID=7230 RepID=UPI0013EEB66F|nr:lysozyme P-like [Drosophila mojavensis]